VPFHDAPTYAMRKLHRSRGNCYGSQCSRRLASVGSGSVGQGVAGLGGITVSGSATGLPSHLIEVLECSTAADCSDATENGRGWPFPDVARSCGVPRSLSWAKGLVSLANRRLDFIKIESEPIFHAETQ
jgi:hypothetical protein